VFDWSLSIPFALWLDPFLLGLLSLGLLGGGRLRVSALFVGFLLGFCWAFPHSSVTGFSVVQIKVSLDERRRARGHTRTCYASLVVYICFIAPVAWIPLALSIIDIYCRSNDRGDTSSIQPPLLPSSPAFLVALDVAHRSNSGADLVTRPSAPTLFRRFSIVYLLFCFRHSILHKQSHRTFLFCCCINPVPSMVSVFCIMSIPPPFLLIQLASLFVIARPQPSLDLSVLISTPHASRRR